MRRRRDEVEDAEIASEEEEEYLESRRGGKRRRSEFIDDVAEEDDDDEEEEEDEDEVEGGSARRRGRKSKKRSGMEFLDIEAAVDLDDEEEEEADEGQEDFIDDGGAELQDEDVQRGVHYSPSLSREEDEEDSEAIERRLKERFAWADHEDSDEETTDVEQQALLPSVRDPKLWAVKCAIGHEREAAVCLMQKSIAKGSELRIRSAIALDHLKNYIYVEADKEAHVKEACKGLRNIYSAKVMLVPIKEMTDVLYVERKANEVSRDTWVRIKLGSYKGDLAKVVDVDNVRQRVTVQLIPRIDLQALSNKLDGGEVVKKKLVPPQRFMDIDTARYMHIRVERRNDPRTGDYFEIIGGMKFKDGFLFKTVAIKSISSQNIHPTFDELDKFRKPGAVGGDIASFSALFTNRKKGHFMKGDAVIVVKGDLKNAKGRVEKVEDEMVHIKPDIKDFHETVPMNENYLCKFFKVGDHVKVVSGVREGATGMVVKVEGHVLIIISDTTKEDIRVFADHVVESSEVTTDVTKIGDYELHDLVLLDNGFGVIIRIESEAFQVLKGNTEKSESASVKLREIKTKLKKRFTAQDRYKKVISVKDLVRIVEGPYKDKHGPAEHIYGSVIFINDRQHPENAGYICAKAQSCIVKGGSGFNTDRNGGSLPAYQLRAAPQLPQSFGRPPIWPSRDSGGRQRSGGPCHHLVGTTVRIRSDSFKGYRGVVIEVNGQMVRVELESQMRIVTVNLSNILENVSTRQRETPLYGLGSETPMHSSRTPLHPYTTPNRDPRATPIHEGMRTPMPDRAWNPMTPARDVWDEEKTGSWRSTPQHQQGTLPTRPYEASTPGSGWANTHGGNYNEVGTPRESSTSYASAPSPYTPTPEGHPLTPNSTSYLPDTPGGQPMTPDSSGLDVMFPSIGGEGNGSWFLPDISVNVRRSGEGPVIGVVREVLWDGSCKVHLGSGGETITAFPNEMEFVKPKKSDKIKIMDGAQRGVIGKLIGVDNNDGIVKVDKTLDVKIIDLNSLAKLVQ